jgi:outer membrane lipase/esterase
MKTLRVLLVSLLAAATPPAVAAYDGLYVFGDSLSDDGNLFSMTGGLYPPAPYFDGRFSNGQVAVEYLASTLGIGLNNFAIAGARTGTPVGGGPDDGTGVRAQVDTYLGLAGGTASDKGLYFIWAGPNDYFALAESPPDVAVAGAYIANAIDNLQLSISALYGAGARDFLIPNMPNLGLTPRIAGLGSETAFAASWLSSVHNAQLGNLLAGLGAALPDVRFFSADTYALTTAASLDPAAYGFSNATQACIESIDCVQSNGDGYLFWDGVHVTTAAHARLAGVFAGSLAPVPEARTWAMLLSGLALLTVAARLQRRTILADASSLSAAT